MQNSQANIHLDITVLAAYLDGSSYRDSTNCESTTCLFVCLFVCFLSRELNPGE